MVPVYNGAGTIGELVQALRGLKIEGGLEIVLVVDCSPDNSLEVCKQLAAESGAPVTVLSLSRNFGEHNAVMAGLHHARGEHVVIMDDDFQNPPEEVSRLIEHARGGGYDVVYTRYARKRHHWGRNVASRLNDRVATIMLDKPRDLYLSSFKCLTQFTVQEILKYRGPYPYIDGLVLRCTRNIGTLAADHAERRVGRSGYTLRKLVALGLNMFVNFSIAPLRLSALLGVAASGIGVILGIDVVVERLLRPGVPVGWASIPVAVLVFAGVQLIMLGLIGEYLGRLFLTENQTPQFVVREVVEKL